MMRENRVRETLKRGGTALGTFVKIADPSIVEILGLTGYDFFVVDDEHGDINRESLINLFRASESTGIVPLVRLAENTPVAVQKVLDAGALGVMGPHMETREDALALVRAARYLPRGERGIGTVTRAARYGTLPFRQYLEMANDNILLVGYCESTTAVRNLDTILSVDELDVVFVGPMDLSQSMGLVSEALGKVDLEQKKGDGKDPRLVAVIEEVGRKVRAAGKAPGIIAGSPAEALRWAEKGFQYLAISCDQAMFASLAKRFADEFRVLARESTHGGGR